MITYRIKDVISQTQPLYKKIKMLVYAFHLEPEGSVLYLNDVEIGPLGPIWFGTKNVDYGKILLSLSPSISIPDLSGEYLNHIYNHLGSKYLNYYIGQIIDPTINSTYTKWYYLITLVDPITGIALNNASKMGLTDSIKLVLDDRLLSSGQPILRYSRLYALPIDNKCGVVRQTGISQTILAT